MPKKKNNYTGNLIIANPLNPDDQLSHGVILIVSQSIYGTLGLQINETTDDLTIGEVCKQIGIVYSDRTPVYKGGAVSPNKVQVIHSLDWQGMTTVELTKDLGVTSDISILSAISRDQGPEFFKACVGAWRWENDLLEQQLDPKSRFTEHAWEMIPASIDNVFSDDPKLDQWHHAIEEAARIQVANWF